MIPRRLLLLVLAGVAVFALATYADRPAVSRVLAAARRAARWAADFILRRYVLLVSVLALASFAFIYAGPQPPSPVIRADGQGYYVFLPGYLIYHDPTLKAVAADLAHGEPTIYDLGKGLTRDPHTGNYLERYGIGESVMMSPFFLVAHRTALLLHLQKDGYTPLEQFAAGMSGLFYMCAGTWFLRALLLRYFTPRVTLATLVSMTFGTSLFHYGTYDSIFSHAYSFFLVAALLWLIPFFYERRARLPAVIGIGVVAGLIVLVRSANVVILLAIPLLGAESREALRSRARLLRAHWLRSVVVAAVFGLLLLPQLAVWHIATGHWLVSSYQGDTGYFFSPLQPHFPEVLFSFLPHGMLPFAPVLAFAIAGLIPLRRRHPGLFPATFAVFALVTYVIAIWSSWWFGGGFGHRGFIDVYPLLALALGAFYESIPPGYLRGVVGTVAAAMILVTMLQMLHFWQHLMPVGGVSAKEYLRILAEGQP